MKRRTTLLTTALLFSLTTINAQATLINETVNGVNLVYDSVTNTTWTQDANLLSTMLTNAINQYGSDNKLVSDIVNATSGGVIYDVPNAYDNGTYTLNTGMFDSEGFTTWWGARAFVNYLDSINYGGSSQWALPTEVNGIGYSITDTQMGELFYNELGGTQGNPVSSGQFINLQTYLYWSGTELPTSSNPYSSGMALAFNFGTGQEGISKGAPFLAWAVSQGNVATSTVALPNAIWMFGTGLLGLRLVRRNTSKNEIKQHYKSAD
ncbi:hypothetical protein [Methylomonas sp. AM2-LC]|uniref:hypothetical protein n=1 Tax=Methylomonas sp. AM2-LC TaxID=3153301 RepID=UPI0032635E9D